MLGVNPFLGQVMRRVRIGRPPLDPSAGFFVRMERIVLGNYAAVWFLTQGCSWDRRGGCTMCNYGRGRRRSHQAVLASVSEALSSIGDEVFELLVSPSGGMLDDWEVPAETRRSIYELVAHFPCRVFSIETRPETVSAEKVAELRALVPDRDLAIEVGLESSDPWIQRYCVNRGNVPAQFKECCELAKRDGVQIYGNVSLGTAFLTPRESIDDAVRTVEWGLDAGASSMVVFPLHVKPFTLLEALWRDQDYTPPSLWALVETLLRLRAKAPRVQVSWYRDYVEESDPEIASQASPTTCPHCIGDVLRLLDLYRESQATAVLDRLQAYSCACRSRWRATMESTPTLPLQERVLRAYRRLSRKFELQWWWADHGELLEREMHSTSGDSFRPA